MKDKKQKQEIRLYDKPTLYTMTKKENQVKCKCGHTVEFWHGENKVICGWCGDYVFKSKLEEIKYRMKGRLKK